MDTVYNHHQQHKQNQHLNRLVIENTILNFQTNKEIMSIGATTTQGLILNKNNNNSIINNKLSNDNLPKPFIIAMRTLFELMDDQKTGFIKFIEIEKRWEDDGSKGLPKGVIECLRKVTPSNGLLTFERFCAGLKMSLLKKSCNNIGNEDIEINLKPPWNTNTATVRPNNAQLPAQRTLSLPQIVPTPHESNFVVESVVPIIPALYGPPKPPRMSLEQRAATNNNLYTNSERLDKAEIRTALQNWQMGILMNDMESKTLNNGRGGQLENCDDINFNNFQKKTITRRREPRRHTLQNGIDYNMLKKLKQFEQEKEVLIDGLNAVENARDWYMKKIGEVQEKMKYLGRTGSHVEQWSESQKERLDLQRARVLEVNRHLSSLAGSWERGGFPLHMNLALRHSNAVESDYSQNIVNRLKQQNRQLTDEVSKKSERITILEREKNNLLREVVQIQKSLPINDNVIEISGEIVF